MGLKNVREVSKRTEITKAQSILQEKLLQITCGHTTEAEACSFPRFPGFKNKQPHGCVVKGSQKLQEGRSWVRLGGTQRPSVTARGQNSTVTSTHYVLFYICVLFENKKKKKRRRDRVNHYTELLCRPRTYYLVKDRTERGCYKPRRVRREQQRMKEKGLRRIYTKLSRQQSH